MIAHRHVTTRAIIGVVLGGATFFGCGLLIKQFAGQMSALAMQWTLKVAMIVIALLIWRFTGRGWREMGWQPSRPCRHKWIWYLIAALAMGLATILMILTNSRHPVAAQLSFPQLIVTIWLLSSISEEIFVRGLVQSWIAAPFEFTPRDRGWHIVIFASALLFGGMHVPLIWKGAGPLGGCTIVAATFVLGWAAAEIRARSGSLLHAIGVHIVGNVAALPFGIIGAIFYRIIYGKLPIPH
ncbi:hypothetical protein BH09PLA1_BH09PLA1_19010 [soil metagenome]